MTSELEVVKAIIECVNQGKTVAFFPAQPNPAQWPDPPAADLKLGIVCVDRHGTGSRFAISPHQLPSPMGEAVMKSAADPYHQDDFHLDLKSAPHGMIDPPGIDVAALFRGDAKLIIGIR